MKVSVKSTERLPVEDEPTLLKKMRRCERRVEAFPSRGVLKHVTSIWGVWDVVLV